MNGGTSESLTALHLAAGQNQLKAMKLLVDRYKADINSFSPSYGTPLHCAAHAGHAEAVSYLLRQGARADMRIRGKLQARDVCVDEEVKEMLAKYAAGKKNAAGERDLREEFYKDLLIPARPPKVRGPVCVLVPERLEPVKRYFFLDVTEYQFVMYEDKSCYPDKQMGSYPLIQMRHVKKVPNIIKDKKYYGFKFECNGEHILCCENKLTTDIWIDYLNSALEYAKFVRTVRENIILSGTEDNKNMMKELLRAANTRSQPEVEVEDTNQENVSFSEFPSHPSLSEEVKDPFENTENVSLDSFRNMDKDMEKIGHGAFGSVFKVTHASTGRVYAMKVVSKNFLHKTKQLKYAISESQVLRIVNHPFIIKMHYAFQDERYLYFVIDYCCNGDLSMILSEVHTFSEDTAKLCIAELVLAVEYLHSFNIVYRDLKPENVLIGNMQDQRRRRWTHKAVRLRPSQADLTKS